MRGGAARARRRGQRLREGALGGLACEHRPLSADAARARAAAFARERHHAREATAVAAAVGAATLRAALREVQMLSGITETPRAIRIETAT
ncbi:MAG: hypothetical protein ACK6CU_31385 [Deltaproteobacteria bacterium]